MAYWDEEEKKVRVVSIGIGGAGNLSEEAASGIDFSLLPFDQDDFRVVFISQGTNVGGGCTRSLFIDLRSMGRVSTISE